MFFLVYRRQTIMIASFFCCSIQLYSKPLSLKGKVSLPPSPNWWSVYIVSLWGNKSKLTILKNDENFEEIQTSAIPTHSLTYDEKKTYHKCFDCYGTINFIIIIIIIITHNHDYHILEYHKEATTNNSWRQYLNIFRRFKRGWGSLRSKYYG